MAQFTTAERTNAAFKQVFRVLGTSNTDDALGKKWYEELYSSVNTILPRHFWADGDQISYCSSLAAAQALAASKPLILSDRSVALITLTKDTTSNGRLWIARLTPGDENSDILGDWIQPNDFPNPAGQPANGFACVLYDGANNVITATEGAWVPFYPLGCIVLGAGQAVGQGELAGYIEPLKVAVFRYIGQKGITPTTSAAGGVSSFIRREEITPTDGQTAIRTAWTPADASLEFYLNGQLRTLGTDYTIDGRDITWLDPFNPDLGVNVPLKATDKVILWYVNGTVRTGTVGEDFLDILVNGQTAFTLGSKPLTPAHLQLFYNGQLCDPSWYTYDGDMGITWLNPVLPLAPAGLLLRTIDRLTAQVVVAADSGEGSVKRGFITIGSDGQTMFTRPAGVENWSSMKLYLNGQLCTQGGGKDWLLWPMNRFRWLDPLNTKTGLPLTLKTTDELYYIADNLGAKCCGATKFTELSDAPPSFVGHAGEVVTVNPTEDGLVFAPAVLTKARALIDPLGAGDYDTIMDALADGADKLELMPNRVFAERVIVNRSDVDILGYMNSVVIPPVGSAEAFILDGAGGMCYRLRFTGFTVQMTPIHPTNFCAFRSTSGNLREMKFRDLMLNGYLYYPGSPIDASCGIALANTSNPIEDVEVTSVLFQNWEYSCFTMWGSLIRDVRVLSCMLRDYRTFGMDWYNGVSEIMINNNNFRTQFWDTPIGIAIPETKSLFINGTNHHITFQNNTFYGAGKGGGSAIVISGHAGTPWDVNIECNTIRNFKNAIYFNSANGRYRVVGNANSEGGAVTDDNADGLVIVGGGSFFIGHNTVDV